MRIILEENQKDQWDKFIVSSPGGSFLQSWIWGEFQKSFGQKIWRLIIEGDGKFFLAALIIKHNLPFGWSYFYCPRPIIKSQKLIELFLEEIKNLAEKEKAVFLKIDPTELFVDFGKLQQRFWKSMSFRPTKPVQPRHTLILDISKSEEEILAQMKQKTRYNIRLAEKKGVKIKKISQPNSQEIEIFWDLLSKTSKRDKFSLHPKNYYQKMLENLGRDSMAELFFAEYQDKIIGANIVVFFSDKAVYLHGASSDEYRQVMAPYLLHWVQIKEAKKRGCRTYDFWGIENKLKVKSNKLKTGQNTWTGITRFKKGFGGEEISYPESYDIIFNSFRYWVYKIGKKF